MDLTIYQALAAETEAIAVFVGKWLREPSSCWSAGVGLVHIETPDKMILD